MLPVFDKARTQPKEKKYQHDIIQCAIENYPEFKRQLFTGSHMVNLLPSIFYNCFQIAPRGTLQNMLSWLDPSSTLPALFYVYRSSGVTVLFSVAQEGQQKNKRQKFPDIPAALFEYVFSLCNNFA